MMVAAVNDSDDVARLRLIVAQAVREAQRLAERLTCPDDAEALRDARDWLTLAQQALRDVEAKE